jgi:hypothetical protein
MYVVVTVVPGMVTVAVTVDAAGAEAVTGGEGALDVEDGAGGEELGVGAFPPMAAV